MQHRKYFDKVSVLRFAVHTYTFKFFKIYFEFCCVICKSQSIKLVSFSIYTFLLLINYYMWILIVHTVPSDRFPYQFLQKKELSYYYEHRKFLRND